MATHDEIASILRSGSISDNGIGFDPSVAPHNGGIGLLSMKERVRLVDGENSLKSKPGRGTQIDIWVPLADKTL